MNQIKEDVVFHLMGHSKKLKSTSINSSVHLTHSHSLELEISNVFNVSTFPSDLMSFYEVKFLFADNPILLHY